MASHTKCSYCKKPITCGCQKSRNSKGETVHKSCVRKSNEKKNSITKLDPLTQAIQQAHKRGI